MGTNTEINNSTLCSDMPRTNQKDLKLGASCNFKPPSAVPKPPPRPSLLKIETLARGASTSHLTPTESLAAAAAAKADTESYTNSDAISKWAKLQQQNENAAGNCDAAELEYSGGSTLLSLSACFLEMEIGDNTIYKRPWKSGYQHQLNHSQESHLQRTSAAESCLWESGEVPYIGTSGSTQFKAGYGYMGPCPSLGCIVNPEVPDAVFTSLMITILSSGCRGVGASGCAGGSSEPAARSQITVENLGGISVAAPRLAMRNAYGVGLLQAAVFADEPELVRELLAQLAAPQRRMGGGGGGGARATISGAPMIPGVVPGKSGPTALLVACASPQTSHETFGELLRSDTTVQREINQQWSLNGHTPALAAAANPHEDGKIKLAVLLALGADPDISGWDGRGLAGSEPSLRGGDNDHGSCGWRGRLQRVRRGWRRLMIKGTEIVRRRR